MKPPTQEEALRAAFHQLRALGRNAIGVRGTPVISVWEMRPKWEKWGQWFTTIGTDGDTEMTEFWWSDLETKKEFRFKRLIEPLMLRLFYIRVDNKVIQLAWIDREAKFWDPRTIESERYSRCA